MTRARSIATIAAAFLVSNILATVIHGFVLAGDYEPFEGTLLRTGYPPSWQMLFLPVAHLCFISALVWVYARVPFGGSRTSAGLTLGVVGWVMGQAPLWLIWYAEQPWPGSLVVKQLTLELMSAVIIGLTIVLVAGSHAGAGLSRTGSRGPAVQA